MKDRGNSEVPIRTVVQEIVGYLNFSAGAPDVRFQRNLDELFRRIAAGQGDFPPEEGGVCPDLPVWRRLGRLLRQSVDQLRGSSEAFRRTEQAEAALDLVFDHLLEAYRRHHHDLLFHQTDEALFQPFFIGRACEAVLAEGAPWDQRERIIGGALTRLNDFLGHRPVAVLRTEQKIQPYAHERVRPIPLFIAGAGVAFGPYQELIQRALDILSKTDAALLEDAWFDLSLLDELAVDPRAFDFDHPVNRRPNYQFGQWDPHHLDQQGRYRRFVLQQVTLDTMHSRINSGEGPPEEELLHEAAAVLAGTMLMGSAISGDRPEAHDSTVSLATLLPHIAACRDAFYEQFLKRLHGAHGRRLRAEAKRLHQPLGGARQHLNRELARRRARQLQHAQLAQLFARMGYTEAASRQARVIPGTAARLKCEIQCRLSTAHLAIDAGRLEEAAAEIPEIEELLHRGIECGALVDPWNILGFGGQFSLFRAIENSIHDHRIDELIELIGMIFELSARLQKEAAAAGQGELVQAASARLGKLASWWDQFASTEVSSVAGISGRESWESAAHVAAAVGAWHEAGSAAGDIAFWQGHIAAFRSPKAYAQVIEALLEQRDPVAAMALLIQWISQSDEISLTEENYSFFRLAARWMRDLWRAELAPARVESSDPDQPAPDQRAPDQQWALARKFFDYLEANAGPYWEVPRLDLGDATAVVEHGEEESEEEDDAGGLYSAAYENVSYRDSTDDGLDADIVEWGETPADFELAAEGDRIIRRLAFWNTVARMWTLAVGVSARAGVETQQRDDVLCGWLAKATANQAALAALLAQAHRYRVPAPRGTAESMIEYERRREVKEMLLERIISACVENADAARQIRAGIDVEPPARAGGDWEQALVPVMRGLVRCDRAAVAKGWPDLQDALRRQPLLYVPTARGGNPERIVASQNLQRELRRLLATLPRLGLLHETYELLDTVRMMEREHSVGPGAITEFDRLFDTGYKAIVRCLVASSEQWRARGAKRRKQDGDSDGELVECLEAATSPLLGRWFEHSHNIRLSPMESIGSQRQFASLRKFIERYGNDWFTQQFMNYGNLRAILLQGVEAYLDSLEDEPEAEPQRRLLEETPDPAERQQAARSLELILEAVIDHYGEYMDYNSTTTQSDRGEMLYTLLDFLRLLAAHQRVAWNLRPLVTAHEVLVRCGRSEAAEMWRDAIVDRVGEIADDHLAQFDRLVRKYGMRLATIADRFAERFARPLVVDRLRAMVRPAIEELREGRQLLTFPPLEEETNELADEPSGVGFEIPSWLEGIDEEIGEVEGRDQDGDGTRGPELPIPQVRLSRKEIERQLEPWTTEAEPEEDEE